MLSAPAAAVVVLVIVGLAVAVRRLLASLRLAERHTRHLDEQIERLAGSVEGLEGEKRLLSGFLGVLPALAHELRYAGTDRQITTTLLDTLVSTIEPRAAAVLMRRRQHPQETERGARFAVAATIPPDSPAHVGLEIVLAADGHDPATYDGEAAQRAGLPLPDPLLTAPLILETEVVGLLALTPSESAATFRSSSRPWQTWAPWPCMRPRPAGACERPRRSTS